MTPNGVRYCSYLDYDQVVVFPFMNRPCECECRCPLGMWSTDPEVTICAYCENPELLGPGGTVEHDEIIADNRAKQHAQLKEM
ncbi:hypothetical protein [Brevibacterium casei]|uniref:Uncharacterized protein n=1 Tax=Brevibacterium casei TaxID=33889 RepID=A0A7T2THG7_9MICO|nr:hypothetical protein [Brevibacterium casei]QPS33992.1 hypothetical protein I6G59_01215 [Brevibacterium casei]